MKIKFQFIRNIFYMAGIGMLIGLICGFVGGAFSIAVSKVTLIRTNHPWVLYGLPIAGLLIVLIYRLLQIPMTINTDSVLESVESQKPVSPFLSVAMFISTVLTHLCGGSAGREGAALQIGGALGSAVAQVFRIQKEKVSLCILCGMAAVFSALFGTPLAAAFFVLEVLAVGRWNPGFLLPCILSASVAKLCASAIGAPADNLSIHAIAEPASPVLLLQAILIGFVSALIAVLLIKTLHLSSKYFRKWLYNDYLRIAVGGFLVILFTLLFQTNDYNGGGMNVIEEALNGTVVPWAFAAKIFLTAITLGAGYRGGEIVPSLFIGATLGCFVAPFIGMEASLGAAFGMIGVFAAVTNAPIASFLLFSEMLGSHYLLPAGITIAVAFVLSGKNSLYHAQRYEP